MAYYLNIDSLGSDDYRVRVTELVPSDDDPDKLVNGKELLRFEMSSPLSSDGKLRRLADKIAREKLPDLE